MNNFLQEKPHKALMEAIKEYLQHQGYVQVLKVLEIESVPESSTTLYSLLSSLDRGDSSSFFKTWPSVLKGNSVQISQLQELEFFVRVFFTIFPCHQSNNIKKDSAARYKRNMEEFKQYLDQEGPNIVKSDEVLSFFALPYMPSPQEHPAFRHIFTPKWLNALKDKIRVLVGKEDLQNAPILQKMYDKYIDPDRSSDARLLSQISSLEKQLAYMNEENEKLRQRVCKMESGYEDYFNEVLMTAKDMFELLEASRHGGKVNDAMIEQIFTTLKKYDKSLKPPANEQQGLVHLNYAIIIKDLSSLQDDLKVCALLQALRWRLTRTAKAVQKEYMENYIKFNILCTQKPHDVLLDQLLTSTRRVKEYTMRILNIISSDKSGRVYLLQKESLVKLLVSLLVSEKQDSLLRQNTLGVLQKLSLTKSAQVEMIRLDVLDWLLKILKLDIDSISEYTLEYATALLMNLSLRSLGKDLLCKNPAEVISILTKFISHENTQVRTYINGTLYSILTKKQLKEAAVKQGVEKKLRSLLNKSDDNIRRQINFILDQIRNDEGDCFTDEGDEDIEEAQDSASETEPDELEDLDDLINVPNYLTGEALLKQRYERGVVRKEEEKKNPINLKEKRIETEKKKIRSKDSLEYSQGFSSRDRIPRTPYQNN